jgi:hypothetical protein
MSELNIKTTNPAGYSTPTYSNYGTVTNSREMPRNPPPGAAASQGSWQPRSDGATGWQWVDNPGYNYIQRQKEEEARINAELNAPPATPTELPGAFGAPKYNAFALQRSQPLPGAGAFGAQPMQGARSDTLVPQLEQIRMQRMVQAYPQFGFSGGGYGVR